MSKRLGSRHKRQRRSRRSGASAAIALGIGLPACAGRTDDPSSTFDALTASDFVVSSLADDGAGSLRAAIAAANDQVGHDMIDLTGLTGTITLTSGQIEILDETTILGPGSGTLAISGNDNSRIFRIHKDEMTPVTISGLSITRGRDETGAAMQLINAAVSLDDVKLTDNHAASAGGAIFAVGKPLTITRSEITNNRVDDGDGGGIFVSGATGDLTIASSRISGNFAHSGAGLDIRGVYANAKLESSTVSDNVATDAGGGIRIQHLYDASFLGLDGTTISDNTSVTTGGGLQVEWNDGAVLLHNSTVSGNESAAAGGGIHAEFGYQLTYFEGHTQIDIGQGSFTIESSTITGSAAAGVWASHGSVSLENSIVAGNGPSLDLEQAKKGAFVIAHSLVQAPGAVNAAAAGDLVGIDPQLGPLANNGGPTFTHLPAAGSPVLDAGDVSLTSGTADQRGEPRVSGKAIDLGAVEVQVVPDPGASGDPMEPDPSDPPAAPDAGMPPPPPVDASVPPSPTSRAHAFVRMRSSLVFVRLLRRIPESQTLR